MSATLPKQFVLALARQNDVGTIYLNDGKLNQRFMDPGLQTDRVPVVRVRGANGAGTKIAIVEDDNVDFDQNNDNDSNGQCPPAVNGKPSTHNCFDQFDPQNVRDSQFGLLLDHATLVASIAASSNRQNEGVAPAATILSAGVTWSTEYVPTADDYTAAMNWAIQRGADVLNASQGGCAGDSSPSISDKVFDYFAQTQHRLIVFSAGDIDKQDCGNGVVAHPGRGWNVLAVGSYADKNNAIWTDDYMDNNSSWKIPVVLTVFKATTKNQKLLPLALTLWGLDGTARLSPVIAIAPARALPHPKLPEKLRC